MKYERQDIIQKAELLFWQKGFTAVGMRELQQHLDMRPGSIYAQFGSKEGIFSEAVLEYSKQTTEQLQTVACANDIPSALKQFFLTRLLVTDEENYRRRCFVVNSIAERNALPDNLVDLVDASFQQARSEFERVIVKGIESGSFKAQTDVPRTAKWLQTQLVGLSYGLSSDSDDDIPWLVDNVINQLLP